MSGEDKLRQAVAEFAEAMLEKLLQKYRQGYSGWNWASFINSGRCGRKLRDHVRRLLDEGLPQEVDVANFAMFLWRHRRHNFQESDGAKLRCYGGDNPCPF